MTKTPSFPLFSLLLWILFWILYISFSSCQRFGFSLCFTIQIWWASNGSHIWLRQKKKKTLLEHWVILVCHLLWSWDNLKQRGRPDTVALSMGLAMSLSLEVINGQACRESFCRGDTHPEGQWETWKTESLFLGSSEFLSLLLVLKSQDQQR